jgi:putative sigma-54 modulation protein
MKFTFTSRHFRAHETIKKFAANEIEKISRFYDGIMKCEVILSFEKATNSVKTAEVILRINNHHTITAKEKTDDFLASIEGAVDKVAVQLKKYKDKLKSNHGNRELKININQELI